MMDEGVELFQSFYFTNGQRHELSRAPEQIKKPIWDHLQSRPRAKAALNKKGIMDPEERLLVYAFCVSGGFQGKPDIVDGKLVETEYHDCGKRGNCDIEGDLCCSKIINGNIITAREIELSRWIASGLPDKIIADKMNISVKTINPMKRAIGQKIGSHNKVDITRFFIQNNFAVYDHC